MNALIRAAADLQAVCEAHQWRFCFIGGLAVLRWGEPRETVDVGLTPITGFGHESEFVSILVRSFQPRIDDAATFAQVNRVLLLRAASGVGLDIALGGLPFEELAVTRSTVFTYPADVRLRTCSAEDLIVLKAFADRPKDWMDIEGVIVRQSDRLDWPYVRAQLAPLAELKAPQNCSTSSSACGRVSTADRSWPIVSFPAHRELSPLRAAAARRRLPATARDPPRRRSCGAVSPGSAAATCRVSDADQRGLGAARSTNVA